MMIHHLAASSTASTDPLLPTAAEFIIGTILFVLVFGIMAKVFLPRIQQVLSQRTELIEGGLARSEEAQTEAKQLLDQYNQQLAEARHEAARMREEAREQGAAIIAEMREQAQAEARRVTEIGPGSDPGRTAAGADLAARRGRHPGHRSGQPDRRRVAHRRGSAEPDGGPVPVRARGVRRAPHLPVPPSRYRLASMGLSGPCERSVARRAFRIARTSSVAQ